MQLEITRSVPQRSDVRDSVTRAISAGRKPCSPEIKVMYLADGKLEPTRVERVIDEDYTFEPPSALNGVPAPPKYTPPRSLNTTPPPPPPPAVRPLPPLPPISKRT